MAFARSLSTLHYNDIPDSDDRGVTKGGRETLHNIIIMKSSYRRYDDDNNNNNLRTL